MGSLSGSWFIVIGIFLSALALVVIFALRNELKRDDPLRQAVHLSFTFLAIGALLAVLTEYCIGG